MVHNREHGLSQVPIFRQDLELIENIIREWISWLSMSSKVQILLLQKKKINEYIVQET